MHVPVKFFLLCAAAALVGCAAGVKHVPASHTPVAAFAPAQPVVLRDDTEIRFDTGYTRRLLAGSKWQQTGSVPQGAVYKPYQSVFTVEGAHIHEAWLVVAEGRLVGFYLPVEQAFSPLSKQVPVSFSTR